MDAIEQLKQDVRDGRGSLDRLVDVVGTLQRQLQAALSALDAAQQRIKELEQHVGGTTAKVAEPFSMRAEEKRQEARGKKKPKLSRKGRRGRLSSADKVKLAERTEKVFPEDIPHDDCHFSHTRPVWRLEGGRAV